MKVKLLKDWGPHKAGDVVLVDEPRAAKLVEDGWAEEDRPAGGYFTPPPGGRVIRVGESGGEAVNVPGKGKPKA